MHLLLRERRLPPAEIAHHAGTVRERLERPQPHHARRGRGVMRRPVHRPGLLLHDPECARREPARLVEVERAVIGVAGAHEALEVGRRSIGHAQVGAAERVIVIRGEIEIAREPVIVDPGLVHRDEIVRDEPAGRQAPQHLDLRIVEAHDFVRREAIPGEAMRRAGLGHRADGQLDLVEAAIFHRPEDVAPSMVERSDIAIAVAAPQPERVARDGRGAQRGVVAAQFVVGLPPSDAGMRAIALGERGDDLDRGIAIDVARKVIVPA